MIVFHHGLLACGWIGVQLFFVLSGYLITNNLVRDRNRPAITYFLDFYRRRSLRIFPVYYAYLALLACLVLVAGKVLELLDYWPYLVTYTYNLTPLMSGWKFSRWFGHFWSLCVEEQFYLLWPLVVFVVSPSRLKTVVIGMILLAPIGRALGVMVLNRGLVEPYLVGPAVYAFPLSHMDAFAFGAALVVFQATRRLARSRRLLLGVGLLVLVLGLVNLTFAATPQWTSLGYPLGDTARGLHVWGYSALNATAAVLILCAAQGKLQWLDHPWLAYVGRISYGAYVVHWAVIMGVRQALGRFLGNGGVTERLVHLSISLPVILLIASASYYWFERPLMSLGRRK